jgi:hypothetical protein
MIVQRYDVDNVQLMHCLRTKGDCHTVVLSAVMPFAIVYTTEPLLQSQWTTHNEEKKLMSASTCFSFCELVAVVQRWRINTLRLQRGATTLHKDYQYV